MTRTKFVVGFIYCCMILGLKSMVLAEPKSNSLEAKSLILWQEQGTQLAFSLKNQTSTPQTVDEPETNCSPIVMIKPNGEVVDMVRIVEWLKPPPPLLPNAVFEKRLNPLERVNLSRTYESGIYRFSLKTVNDRETFVSNEVLLYRDETAPKIDPVLDISIDSPEFAQELIKSGDYTRFQEESRSRQIAATEGTKQFLFVHPYTIALLVDGKQDLQVVALVTNTGSELLKLPVLGNNENYLEIKTPVEQQSFRYPVNSEDPNQVVLTTGQTKKWVVNVSDFLSKHGSARAGNYEISWLINGKKVADFAFDRR